MSMSREPPKHLSWDMANVMHKNMFDPYINLVNLGILFFIFVCILQLYRYEFISSGFLNNLPMLTQSGTFLFSKVKSQLIWIYSVFKKGKIRIQLEKG